MKRICFFSGDITRSGGTERVSSMISNGLARSDGYEVLFLSILEQNGTPFFAIDPSVERHVLKRGGKWMPPGPGYLPLVPALRRFLKRNSIDVIVDIDLVLDCLSIPAAAGLLVKVVSWEHFHYDYEQETAYRRRIARLSARFSDYIVTLTPRDKRNYQEKLRRKGRIDFIYNPLAPEFVGCPLSLPREKLLITVGRLHRMKGIDLLARMIPSILQKHEDWKWLFLGEGEYRGLLEETARRHCLEDRLILAGTSDQVEEYLKRAAIFVLGSRTEPFGMCLLEAKACHVPCVAFDVPYGPSELIDDGINGFLIPPFELEQMAQKISLLIEAPALREQFSRHTAIGMERFQWDTAVEKWDRLLTSLIEPKDEE